MRPTQPPRRSGTRAAMEPLLNEVEVAQLLGVSVRTLQEWRQKGLGPPYLKLNERKRGAVRYDPGDIRLYVAGRRRKKVSRVAK